MPGVGAGAPAGVPAGAADPAARAGRRLVFVCGLHRSGTTPLARALGRHPEVSGLRGTGAKEDEGQHLQPVYPRARLLGGPGRFALDPRAHLTEDSPLATPANAQAMWDAWAPYWDLSRPVVVEKSPPNLVMTRFLQALFPSASFLVITRHPVVVALSTQKWVRGGRLDTSVRHWLAAHETFAGDAPYLERVSVLRYEHLVADPAARLAEVASFLGLGSPLRDDDGELADRSAAYLERWQRLGRGPLAFRRRRLERRYAGRAAALGYDLAAPGDPATTAAWSVRAPAR